MKIGVARTRGLERIKRGYTHYSVIARVLFSHCLVTELPTFLNYIRCPLIYLLPFFRLAVCFIYSWI